MKMPDLATLLPRFFSEHLVQQRNVSPRTIAVYRDTFRLFLRFLHQHRKVVPAELPLTVLTADTVLAFLTHLEHDRHNGVRSRNVRLAAIRSFLHYVNDQLGPDFPEITRRIFAIPCKRHTQPILGFLTRQEIEAILAATDNSWTGRRDHLLFLLLYNTGARVSEIIAVRVRDVLLNDCRQLQLRGKGRKQRLVPLWRITQQRLRRWLKETQPAPDTPLLPNRFGQALTRSGVAWQLQRLVRKAARQIPSLQQRRISPHTFRHSTAMHLLQANVAPELIALWLGHESPNTTHLYVEADLEMKRRILEAVDPPKTRRGANQPNDELLRFLESL